MKKSKFIISIILLSLVVACVILSMVWVLGFGNGDPSANGLAAFKTFTFLSNIYCGITSLLLIIYLLIYKDKPIPKFIKILQWSSVTSVMLTFLTVFLYLQFVYSFAFMILNASLFMHLITPLLAFFALIYMFDKTDFQLKDFIFCVIPMTIYGIYYLINVVVNNGYGDLKYDWYQFAAYGLGIGVLFALLMMLFTGLIAVAIHFLLILKTKIVEKINQENN